MLLDRLLFGSSSDSWLAQYGRTLNDVRAFDMAVDASGNIYVCGEEAGDPLLLKLDRFGNVLWTRRISGLSASFTSVKVDGSGNIYCGGRVGSGNRALLAKYNSSGVLQWKKVDGPAGGISTGCRIHIATSGTIYVIFGADVSGGGLTVVLGYNSSGTVTLRRELENGSDGVLGKDILFDGTNLAVLVEGLFESPFRSAGLLAILNTSGTILTNLSDDDGASSDRPMAMVRGSSGNLYLAHNNHVTKTGASGTVLWQRHYGSLGGDRIIVDGDTPWVSRSDSIFSITPSGVLDGQIAITHASANIVAIALDTTYLYVCLADALIGGRNVASVMKLRRTAVPIGSFAGFTIAIPALSLLSALKPFGAGTMVSNVDTSSAADAPGTDVAAGTTLSTYLGL